MRMGGVRAGARLQVAIIRNNPDYFLDLATAPLFAVIFLALVRNAGRMAQAGRRDGSLEFAA